MAFCCPHSAEEGHASPQPPGPRPPTSPEPEPGQGCRDCGQRTGPGEGSLRSPEGRVRVTRGDRSSPRLGVRVRLWGLPRLSPASERPRGASGSGAAGASRCVALLGRGGGSEGRRPQRHGGNPARIWSGLGAAWGRAGGERGRGARRGPGACAAEWPQVGRTRLRPLSRPGSRTEGGRCLGFWRRGYCWLSYRPTAPASLALSRNLLSSPCRTAPPPPEVTLLT